MVGHAYAEYAVHADYANMREYADAGENLNHIIHIYIYAKNGNFLGQKMGQSASVFNSECPKLFIPLGFIHPQE